MLNSSAVPPRDGKFKAESARLARATIDGDVITIHNVRDSSFPEIDVMDVHWVDETFDVREITNVWVYVGYFGAIRGVAHTEIGFEFADDRAVVASFEIRPMVGQRYSIKSGFGKNFEMCLRWSSERDAMLRRFNRSEDKIDTTMHLYEAAITHSKSMDLFHAAARRTNELFEHPEWYHSVKSSCATNLVELVNEAVPNDMRATPRVLLPGYLPKLWMKQGVLKLNGTLADTLESSRIDDRVKEIGYAPDFTAQLHGRV